ncbi:MAG TPA: TadE/TadG family type IV pilus assembly protein [Candidatus Elarobacter sp.]|jgi:Flp pilus assembly protein TadG|nr:TadE/TadG family type IV pilus assembly protein [Candidatus Elarobacter sp.]
MELGSRHGSRNRHGERGQAIAELACIAPLVLLLLIGVVEVGRFASFSIMVANAARAGVQYGAQNLITAADTTGMQNAATADAQNVSGLTATASYFCKCADGSASTCLPTDCSTSHRLTYVQVNTTGTFTSLVHFAKLTPSVTIASSATMRVSQ